MMKYFFCNLGDDAEVQPERNEGRPSPVRQGEPDVVEGRPSGRISRAKRKGDRRHEDHRGQERGRNRKGSRELGKKTKNYYFHFVHSLFDSSC